MTPQSANKLLMLLDNVTIGELARHDALTAIQELIEIARVPTTSAAPEEVGNPMFNVYVYNDAIRRVEAIKTIRAVGSLGLKEAKDYSDNCPLNDFVGPVACLSKEQLDKIEHRVPIRVEQVPVQCR